MKVLCMLCSQDTPNDMAYIKHMETVHNTSSPDQAMKEDKFKKQNLPPTVPTNLPPGINPADLPDPEFLETLQEIEKAEKQKATTPQPPTSALPTQSQKPPSPSTMPLELKYKWEGYHTCGNTVKTIMIEANGLLFANAYCLICNETVKQIEVQPIPKENSTVTEKKHKINEK